MSKIHLLSNETINKIAAGEVIENPASVVKELVENAVDAHSSEISVEMRGGGLQLIRIVDDGVGMSRDEALLSLERHATSKIRDAEDLFSLRTMGFRGEALASIASISKLTLITALENGEGIRIEVEGGSIIEVSPHARSRGTTLEVRSLFYNVPVRKKFQKTPALCSSEVTRMMTLLSLAHPEVGFSFFKQDTQVFAVQAGMPDRVKRILGETFAEGIYEVKGKGVAGWIGAPLQSRLNRSGQYLFVNRRPIFSPLISLAVKDGYGTRIEENRYPTFVIHLHVDPQEIDVNVHPQKKEVRFLDEVSLKCSIREAVSAAFQVKENLSSSFFTSAVTKNIFSPSFFSETESTFVPSLKFKETFYEEDNLPLTFSKPKSLGIFANYFLLEERGELVCIDLVAARAALIYEKVKIKKIDKQGLLFPEIFETSLEEAELLLNHMDVLAEAGIVMRPVGARSFMVEAIPTFLEEGTLRQTVLSLVPTLRKSHSIEDLWMEVARLFSSTSRRSKLSFMLQEAEALFEELQKNRALHRCPQGKPTIVYLNGDEIEKFFSRRV